MHLPGVDLKAADAYRSRLGALLEDDHPTVQSVFTDWCAHVRRHHGAVVAAVDEGVAVDDGETVAARQLVLDALTFDAAVNALQGAVERAFEVRVDPPTAELERTPAHDAVGVSLAAPDDADPEALSAVDAEDLRRLYERTVPETTRRVFGEYYTPPGLAELGVDAVASHLDDFSEATVVDPGCGAGAFLTAALERKCPTLVDAPGRTNGGAAPRPSGPPRDPAGAADDATAPTTAATLARLTASVVGIDVNPVAVAAARTAYLLTLLPLLRAEGVERVSLPVFLGDALGLSGEVPTTGVEGRAAALVGNPPWVPWNRLPSVQKRRLREGPVERLGLFDHEGATARLGHANDDLSLPFVWTCLDRYLAPDGVAAFVLKRDLLRGPAGRVLRSGRVGERPLSTRCVHDFSGLDPFDGVDADAALCVFEADVKADVKADSTIALPGGSDASAPDETVDDDSAVPAVVWSRGNRQPRFDSLAAMEATLTRTATALRPLDPADPASPWVRADAEDAALGDCEYEIRHGVKDDAKAVFSLDRDALSDLEPTHVYPYLRSKHVVKWGLFGYDLFLVPQRRAAEDNEAELEAESPRTYAYLDSHRERLTARGSSWFDSGPFYTLFGLGPYTWSTYKVVWCRLGFKPHFAVVSDVEDPDLGRKPVVPGDHCMFLSTEHEAEAHYLCALLNSAPYQRCLHDVAGRGKASLSKRVVSSLALPPWRASEAQRRLADLSRRAHGVVPDYVDRSKRAYNELRIPELEAVESNVDAAAEQFLASR